MLAVRADDAETAQLLIRAGANVNAANHYGVTPLVLAATNANAAVSAFIGTVAARTRSTHCATGATEAAGTLMNCACAPPSGLRGLTTPMTGVPFGMETHAPASRTRPENSMPATNGGLRPAIMPA